MLMKIKKWKIKFLTWFSIWTTLLNNQCNSNNQEGQRHKLLLKEGLDVKFRNKIMIIQRRAMKMIAMSWKWSVNKEMLFIATTIMIMIVNLTITMVKRKSSTTAVAVVVAVAVTTFKESVLSTSTKRNSKSSRKQRSTWRLTIIVPL